ncbi:MAG TPA: hypothetical protein DIT18_02545, partial [Pseudomonas sp.]|nr:hypothetical protein [Pseudomonas sp.]
MDQADHVAVPAGLGLLAQVDGVALAAKDPAQAYPAGLAEQAQAALVAIFAGLGGHLGDLPGQVLRQQ